MEPNEEQRWLQRERDRRENLRRLREHESSIFGQFGIDPYGSNITGIQADELRRNRTRQREIDREREKEVIERPTYIEGSYNLAYPPNYVPDEPLYIPRTEANPYIPEVNIVNGHNVVETTFKGTEMIQSVTNVRASKKKVFYRVIQHKADNDYLNAQNYTHAIGVQDTEPLRTSNLVESVIAKTLISCMDITNIKHDFNGKFHCVRKYDKDEQIRQHADGVKVMEFSSFTVFFQIMPLWGVSFGMLSININPDDHNLHVQSLPWAITTGRAIFMSGGLGGYDVDLIKNRYSSFTLNVLGSTGTRFDERNNTIRHGFVWRLGPYDIDSLLGEEDAMNELIAKVQEDLNKIIADFIDKYQDDDDLIEAQGNLNLKTRALNKKLELVGYKLFPRVHRQKPIYDMENITLYEPAQIKQDAQHMLILPDIQYAGDKVDKRAPFSKKPTTYARSAAEHDEINEDIGDLGCIIDKNDKLEVSIARLKQIWVPPAVQDYNCLLRCLMEWEGSDVNDMNYKDLRESIGIDHQLHIGCQDLTKIANEFNTTINLYVIKATPYASKTLALRLDPEESRISHIFSLEKSYPPIDINPNTRFIDILTKGNHAYLIRNRTFILNKVKCNSCSQWINRSGFSKHITSCFYCTECRRAFHNTKQHNCTGTNNRRLNPNDMRERFKNKKLEVQSSDWIKLMPATLGKKISPSSKIWFADMEAYPNIERDDEFEPYAIGIMCLNDKDSSQPTIFYGENCMADYLKFLTENVKGTLYYYNGSAFDNYIHLRGMVDNNYYIDGSALCIANGRILSFNQNSKLKIHDLYLFISSSLKDGCKNWGVPTELSKKDFEHDKVFSMASAMQYQEEVTEYLKFDVISLATLFSIYHQTMWKCFSMDMNLCITPSQFAIKVWTSGIEQAGDIYVPHMGKEEDDDRAAYYGGRVMCQYKEYCSLDWEDSPDHRYNYDDIMDYLVLGDVNSLYPAAQMQFGYAYGKWKYITPEEGDNTSMDIINDNTNIDWIRRCMFLVDVKCPTDLITSFLMERDAKGKVVHNLIDKVKCWYWGPELSEAILLGYRVTRLYEIKEFEKFDFIFKKYVTECWNGRQQSPSGSARNLAFKFVANSLTGKFGQKSHQTSTSIYNTNYTPAKKSEQLFEDLLTRVVDFCPIFTNTGENNAIILESENAKGGPAYPIYLSAQILANARVIMSRIMRICGSYRDSASAIYYTDTDSLVIPPHCVELLRENNLIGKELGQIKCDINKKFGGQFAKIIRAVWAATKGPYSLVFVLPDEHEAYEKVKMKGIPHPDEFFKYHSPYEKILAKEEQKIYDMMVRWLQDPLKNRIPARVIGKRFYVFKDESQIYFAEHITFKMIRRVMNRDGELYAFFGSMKKCFYNHDGKILMIKPDTVRRTVGKAQWWNESKRIYLEGNTGVEDLSYPPGYINLR